MIDPILNLDANTMIEEQSVSSVGDEQQNLEEIQKRKQVQFDGLITVASQAVKRFDIQLGADNPETAKNYVPPTIPKFPIVLHDQLRMLIAAFGLKPFEVWVLLLCTASGLDKRTMDFVKKYTGDSYAPTPIFVYTLFISSFKESMTQLEAVEFFSSASTLLHWNLIRFVGDADTTMERFHRGLMIDDDIRDFLAGMQHLPRSVGHLLLEIEVPKGHLKPSQHEVVLRMGRAWASLAHQGVPKTAWPVVQVQHRVGAVMFETKAVAAVKAFQGFAQQFLEFRLDHMTPESLGKTLPLLNREARLRDLALIVDAGKLIGRQDLEATVRAFADGFQGLLIICTKEPFEVGRSTVMFDVSKPTSKEQPHLWAQVLKPALKLCNPAPPKTLIEEPAGGYVTTKNKTVRYKVSNAAMSYATAMPFRYFVVSGIRHLVGQFDLDYIVMRRAGALAVQRWQDWFEARVKPAPKNPNETDVSASKLENADEDVIVENAEGVEEIGVDATAQLEPWRELLAGRVPISLEETELRVETLLKFAWEAVQELVHPRIGQMAQLIRPKSNWDQLVLPDSEKLMLKTLAAHVRERNTVYEKWGWAAAGSYGFGISALFGGPSGTGKTMAAEVIAKDLDLDLIRIDLSSVISKYIGETEKNLSKVFDAAESGGAILFFDEGDALFGKRGEVSDSSDRYANVEVAYLLQRMEAFRGLAILTTNLENSLDTAFLRRLRFVVRFQVPTKEFRERIWRTVFPTSTPLGQINFGSLSNFEVSGGSIRNIALNATFAAARANRNVEMGDLWNGMLFEIRKLKRLLRDEEMIGWEDFVAARRTPAPPKLEPAPPQDALPEDAPGDADLPKEAPVQA